jgi:hypothetical protein
MWFTASVIMKGKHETRAHQNVEIAGEPWRAVKRQRMRTDDYELNVVGVQ